MAEREREKKIDKFGVALDHAIKAFIIQFAVGTPPEKVFVCRLFRSAEHSEVPKASSRLQVCTHLNSLQAGLVVPSALWGRAGTCLNVQRMSQVPISGTCIVLRTSASFPRSVSIIRRNVEHEIILTDVHSLNCASLLFISHACCEPQMRLLPLKLHQGRVLSDSDTFRRNWLLSRHLKLLSTLTSDTSLTHKMPVPLVCSFKQFMVRDFVLRTSKVQETSIGLSSGLLEVTLHVSVSRCTCAPL